MAAHQKEGRGWRLGWNPDAAIFKGLLAGDGWTLELTGVEFEDFCRLTQQLETALQAIAQELMAEEQVTCERETERIWIEAEGYPHRYCLRFILLTGRQAEGGWSPQASAELVQAIPSLTLF